MLYLLHNYVARVNYIVSVNWTTLTCSILDNWYELFLAITHHYLTVAVCLVHEKLSNQSYLCTCTLVSTSIHACLWVLYALSQFVTLGILKWVWLALCISNMQHFIIMSSFLSNWTNLQLTFQCSQNKLLSGCQYMYMHMYVWPWMLLNAVPSFASGQANVGMTSTWGRTPQFGAQTPMVGNMTPSYGSLGGMTPLPGAGMRTPLHGSQTPLHGDGTATIVLQYVFSSLFEWAKFAWSIFCRKPYSELWWIW